MLTLKNKIGFWIMILSLLTSLIISIVIGDDSTWLWIPFVCLIGGAFLYK